jgi:hypothetical protein
MLQSLILIDALSSACWEKKKKKKEKKRKKKWLGAFFPGTEVRHTLLAVPRWIFAVRCN